MLCEHAGRAVAAHVLRGCSEGSKGRSTMRTSAPVIIVGAGPAGLALAYELQTRHVDYLVLERQQIGWAWRNHYDRLHLHTLKEVSGLPGWPMPEDYPSFPSALDVARYLERYAAHFSLNIQTGVTVQHASFEHGCWQIQTSQGPCAAPILVMATGIWSTPVRPQIAQQEQFAGTLIHSVDYRNPTPFRGQRVLVVGTGNSGAEIAVDLAQAGVQTSIALRSGINMVPRPRSALAMRINSFALRHLPRSIANWLLKQVRRDFSNIGLPPLPVAPIDAYPVVGYGLAEAVAHGQVQVCGALQSFTPTGMRFSDGQQHDFDAVILATGFRPTLQAVADALELDAAGWPILNHWRSTLNQQLFCLGYSYPTVEGWLQSIGRATSAVAKQIAADVQHSQQSRTCHQAAEQHKAR